MNRLRRARNAKPRMALVERIPLGPRQNLALVEADGRRFLVATSAEGGPAFLALDHPHGLDHQHGVDRRRLVRPSSVAMRVSW
jgi:hypothetical protein